VIVVLFSGAMNPAAEWVGCDAIPHRFLIGMFGKYDSENKLGIWPYRTQLEPMSSACNIHGINELIGKVQFQ
jgi:hypothetical protein